MPELSAEAIADTIKRATTTQFDISENFVKDKGLTLEQHITSIKALV